MESASKNPISQNLPNNLLSLSHLGWDSVYQRPQHLLTQKAICN